MAAVTTAGKRVRRIVMGLMRSAPLALGVAMAACAPISSGTPKTPAKESAAMNAPAADAYRPHTLEEFPELTPEEIGRRFLKLIDSLKTSDDLTLEHMQEVMRLRLTPAPETHGGFFTMHLPEFGWYYGLSYYDVPELDNKHALYQFTNRPTGQDDNDHNADMAPVCGMDFDAYVSALKQMGFVEREDMAQYDSPMSSAIYDPKTGKETFQERRFFRLPGYYFSRGNTIVMLRERREALFSKHPETDPPDDQSNHICVEAISVGVGG